MKIYDISQEIFECKVFPGDPAPKREVLGKMTEGSFCNLSAFSMCAHNGTHVDAPYHFYEKGKTINEIDLEKFIGPAYVAEHNGMVAADDAAAILEKARNADSRSARRILIKGKAVVSEEAAKVFADAQILLLGNESQTVGPETAPMQVHLELLGAEIVLLEGIRLGQVTEGVYLLNAAPINLGGMDGAPCRAVLIEEE
ncbi:MAG: cyclase [Lachnospiraceae bacterium]|nr:cyclase [Lachnospiraceae bacterium]